MPLNPIAKPEPFSNADRSTRWWFGLTIMMAGALRLYHIDFQSLWYDELHSVIPTNPNSSLNSIIAYSKTDQPPLFFLYLHYVFVWFGYHSLTARVASALIGILGIPAMYWLGREVANKEVGLVAAILTAVNYFCIYYSQEVRFYGMSFLLATLSYCFYLRAYRTKNLLDFIGYIVTTVGLLYTHYFGLIIFLTQALTFLILLREKPNMRFIWLSLLSGVVVGILFLPWVPVVLQDAGITSFWIKTPSPFFFFEYFYDYTGKDAITALILLAFLVIAIRAMFWSVLERNNTKLQILGWWILFSYAIPYLWSITKTPLLHPRYTMVTLPAILVLCAVGWSFISAKFWKSITLILLFVGMAVNFSFFKQPYTRLTKDQFREASQYVLTHNSDLPVFSTFSWHFNFYFQNLPVKVQQLSIDHLQVDSFWLLQGQLSQEDAEAEVNRITKNYVIERSSTFFGTRAVMFQRRR